MSPESVHDLHADLFADSGEDERYADPQQARVKAMDYLARREYGRNELCRKLVSAGYTEQATLDAVDKLVSDGLQDDRRYVEAFARSRIEQGKGPLRIDGDLRQRGIDGGLIDDTLAEMGEDWLALARQVRRKKFGAAMPDTFREKARQMRFLQYRGFLPGHIQAAVGSDDD